MKQKKCRNCGEKFTPSSSTVVVCSYPCAIELSKVIVEKSKKIQQMKEKAAMKERVKTLSDYKKELQILINKIARLIDQGCPCISSGRIFGQMHGGHRFAVGGWDNLRFNLMNIWIQCSEQNKWKAGNPTGFDNNLENMGIYNLVHDLPKMYPFVKYSKEQMKDSISKAKKIIKELEVINQKEKLPRSHDDRIMMRKKYNIMLGIYE